MKYIVKNCPNPTVNQFTRQLYLIDKDSVAL